MSKQNERDEITEEEKTHKSFNRKYVLQNMKNEYDGAYHFSMKT